MSEEDPRLALLQAGIDGFNRGDAAASLAMFGDDVEIFVSQELMNAGTYLGTDGYLRMIDAWNEAWQSIEIEISRVEEVGPDHLLVDVDQTAVGAGSGVPVEMEVFWLFEFRDGLVRRFRMYANRESALDASSTGEREENERLLRLGIDAYNRGDLAAAADFFDPDVEFHVAPGLGNPGTWRGMEGYRQMVSSWRDAFAEDYSEVLGIEMVGDRHLIAEMRQRAVGSGSGVPVEMTNWYLMEVRDRRAVRFHIYGDRDAALAAVRE